MNCGAATGQAKPLAAQYLIQAANGARASERQASKPVLPPRLNTRRILLELR